MVLRFPPPPASEVVPTPCPGCGSHRGVLFYATSIQRYVRCIACACVWRVS